MRFTGFTTRWDGAYYLVIGKLGYGVWPTTDPFPRWAFFPGLAGVVRAFDRLGLSPEIGVHVVNQLALLVALVGVHRLARKYGSPRAATLALWSLALFPAAFSFSMTYPSALFLAASVWAFVFVDEDHDLAAGLLVAAATILRPNGLVVAIALVVGLRSVRRIVVVVAPAVLAIAVWCVYCADRTGDALVWITVKSRWQEITIIDAVTGGAKWSLLPHVALGVSGLVVVVIQRRRLPTSWLVLTALVVVLPMATGMVGMARYAGECFPVAVAAGQFLDRWRPSYQRMVLMTGAVGLFLFAFVVGHYDLVP